MAPRVWLFRKVHAHVALPVPADHLLVWNTLRASAARNGSQPARGGWTLALGHIILGSTAYGPPWNAIEEPFPRYRSPSGSTTTLDGPATFNIIGIGGPTPDKFRLVSDFPSQSVHAIVDIAGYFVRRREQRQAATRGTSR